MYHLSPEKPDDIWEVEALYDLCFAPGREALSSYRLRDGIAPLAEISRIARDSGGILAGAVRFWPVTVQTKTALLLGPIAVHPTRQGEGLGGQLMRSSLAQAKEQGWQRVILVGDAPYYQRFGFEQLTNIVMPPPTNPARVLGLSLSVGDAWQGLSGRVTRFHATTA